MDSNNLFKYIFALVVVILIGYTVFVIAHNKSNSINNELDQTSTLTNIKTDFQALKNGSLFTASIQFCGE